MVTDLSYAPGIPHEQPGPIDRFMPPLERGTVTRTLQDLGNVDDLLLDPLGVSPQLVREAAQAGAAVLVAANNPVTRFIIHYHVRSLAQTDLRAALAKFSTAQKDSSRLEPFLKDLYRTLCSRCGGIVSADYFVWDKDRGEPILKCYECPHCSLVTEEQTSEVDRGLALSHAGRGLQFAMALEQISPSGDPDRRHAEAALGVYPGRALFALITLVSKFAQLEFSPNLIPAAEALLLYIFDACNTLWTYPEGRVRPRRLSLSPQYVEKNVWHALENAVEFWSSEGSNLQVSHWPEGGLPRAGMVAIFPGSARYLSDTLAPVVPKRILTTFPRPNQAYWTLSALWAAWLWGRDSAEPIKVALHRRRYDWYWHTRALQAVFSKVRDVLEEGSPVITFMPEAEPGFIGASLLGMDGAGFVLDGSALRVGEQQALFHWIVKPIATREISESDLEFRIKNAVQGMLEMRGEPTTFMLLYAATMRDLAEGRYLAGIWESGWNNPLSVIMGKLETVLYNRDLFLRIGRATEMERGIYWLLKPKKVQEPLSDRVEDAVLKILRDRDEVKQAELFDIIYSDFCGFLTPDKGFVEHCLQSYAMLETDGVTWKLREEDSSTARQRDKEEIRNLLFEIGEKMDFTLSEEDEVIWSDHLGVPQFRFRIQETAKLGGALHSSEFPLTFVLPGGRAALIMDRIRRDPRLSEWLRSGPRIIKFRHIRRLATETTLSRDNLYQRFTIDPPEHHDPQLPLL